MAEKIGIVGVGRMGANMARRLKEVGYPVTAVYDMRVAAAQTLAQELGCEACSTLARVTALADVIITVVTDDQAMRNIFSNTRAAAAWNSSPPRAATTAATGASTGPPPPTTTP